MGRKSSKPVEEKRKPVKVRPIERKHAGRVQETYRLLEELVAAHHSGKDRHLDSAKFILLWRDGWKPDVDKVLTLGRLKKASDLDHAIAAMIGDGYDFAIQLNAEAWPKLSDERKRQVLDHELCHAAPDLDRDGNQKLDAKERLCWRVRKHPIQEFPEILDRYGVQEVLRLNEAAKQAVLDADRPLLAAMSQPGSNGKPSDWRKAGVEALQIHDKKITDAHLEKLRDAGMPNLGEMAVAMEHFGAEWSTGLRFGEGTRQAIEDALGAVRAAAEEAKTGAA